MLAKSLNNSQGAQPPQGSVAVGKRKRQYRWWMAIALPLWVVVGFGLAQLLLVAGFYILNNLGVSFVTMDSSVLNAIMAAVVYALSLAIVIGLPLWIKKYRTTRQDVGLSRLISWVDIGLAPAGFIVYFLCSALLVYIFGRIIPGFNASQVQETGFSNLMHYYEYLLAFITLIVIAPVAEEILFRGFLYGKLRQSVPTWLAMLITSVVFGAIHGQWNVAVDVFALSMVLCSLREVTGNIWAGMLLHMLKNSIAFYVLFINPALLHTIVG